jgi:hypothetical protein
MWTGQRHEHLVTKIQASVKDRQPTAKKPGALAAKPVNGKSDAFTIGLADFDKISAVEGLHLSAEMKKMFREFDRKNLSADARRRRIIARYGNQSTSG